MSRLKKVSLIVAMVCIGTITLNSCGMSKPKNEASSMVQVTDKTEKQAVKLAKEKVEALKDKPRIIATSTAITEICDKLEIDLVGVPQTNIATISDRYKNSKRVGMPMNPDMEVVSSLDADWILSPSSLQSDLQPKYENVNLDWAFVNLRSVTGMYRSIQELGEIFDREKQAKALVDDFEKFYKEYKAKNQNKKNPKVLILMGLPGSYVIATENSYVGNLVELAGGDNVYKGTNQEFLNVNTEDMKQKEPDIILRTAHALPDQVMKMFKEDFQTNDIWKHFDAVKNGNVYDLSYKHFGMSANFQYKEALEELKPLLYPENKK